MPRFRCAQRCDADAIAIDPLHFQQTCPAVKHPSSFFVLQSSRRQRFLITPFLRNTVLLNVSPIGTANRAVPRKSTPSACKSLSPWRAAFFSPYWARVFSTPRPPLLPFFIDAIEYGPSIPAHGAASGHGGNPPHLTTAQSMRQCRASLADSVVAVRRVCTLSAPVATDTPPLR